MVDHADGDEALAVEATWTIVEGLMPNESGNTVSFFHSDGRIIRHSGFVLKLNPTDGSNTDGSDATDLFKNEASWNLQVPTGESLKINFIVPN